MTIQAANTKWAAEVLDLPYWQETFWQCFIELSDWGTFLQRDMKSPSDLLRDRALHQKRTVAEMPGLDTKVPSAGCGVEGFPRQLLPGTNP